MHSKINHALPASSFHCVLGDLGIVEVQGPDTRRFLQGQITQDVMTLTAGQCLLSGCCTPQGRLRAVFWLTAVDEKLLLIMPRELITGFIDGLKKYAVFFKVVIQDVSLEWQIMGLHQAPDFAPATGQLKLELDGQNSLLLFRVNPDNTGALPLPVADLSVWHTVELLSGWPRISAETVEKFLPHHINLPALGGVNFKKGCYTGQEIIARMEFRGKLKTRMVLGWTANTDKLPPGTEIMDSTGSVGELVRSGPHAEQGQLLLLTLNDSAINEICHLNVEGMPILELLNR